MVLVHKVIVQEASSFVKNVVIWHWIEKVFSY
jgi:hypothetical protein